MTKKRLLDIIRGVCIGQFILIMLIVLGDGIAGSEKVIVAASFILGLLFDGFAQTSIKVGLLRS